MSDLELEWCAASEPAPEGIHEGEFLGCEKMPKNEDYGEGVRFKFVVRGGEHDGKMTSNIGTAKPTASNISGRLIKGLLGAEPKPGDKLNLNDYIGKRYTLVVSKNQKGRPVVMQVQKK